MMDIEPGEKDLGVTALVDGTCARWKASQPNV